MELVSVRCTQCMGEVEPLPDGIHGKCLYCGAVFLLPETNAPKANDVPSDEDADYDDEYEDTEDLEEVDIPGIIDDVLRDNEDDLVDTTWGDGVEDSEEDARNHFKIPSDAEVYMILDTTLFGSCKKGLALCDTGLHLRDEDGDRFSADWDEFEDVSFEFEDDELDIDGHKFFTPDAAYVFNVLDQLYNTLY